MAERAAPLSIADLIRAAHQLALVSEEGEIDHVSLAHVMALLGEAALDLALAPEAERDPEAGEVPVLPDQPPVQVSMSSTPSATASAQVPVQDPRRRTLIERLPPVAPVALPDGPAEPLAPPPTTLDQVPYVPPVAGHRLPGPLSRLLRRPRTGHRLDLRRTLDAIARRHSSDRPAFEVEHSLARGALVIADLGPGMAPFTRDVLHLVERVEQVAGHDRVRTHWCTDGRPPTDSVVRKTIKESRPVLVLSDLGVGDPRGSAVALVRAWRAVLPPDAVVLTPRRLLARSGLVPAAVAWDDLPLAGRGYVGPRAGR